MLCKPNLNRGSLFSTLDLEIPRCITFRGLVFTINSPETGAGRQDLARCPCKCLLGQQEGGPSLMHTSNHSQKVVIQGIYQCTRKIQERGCFDSDESEFAATSIPIRRRLPSPASRGLNFETEFKTVLHCPHAVQSWLGSHAGHPIGDLTSPPFVSFVIPELPLLPSTSSERHFQRFNI